MRKILPVLFLALVFMLPNITSAEDVPFSKRVSTATAYNENAATVALFVDLNIAGISDPMENTKLLFDDFSAELTKAGANVVPFEKSYKIFRSYVRENTSAESKRESDLGFAPKKKDFEALAKEAEADYVVYANARVTDRKSKIGFGLYGVRVQETLVIEILVIDKNAQEYMLDEMYSDSASSSSHDSDRAFKKVVAKVLEKIDLSKLSFKKL